MFHKFPKFPKFPLINFHFHLSSVLCYLFSVIWQGRCRKSRASKVICCGYFEAARRLKIRSLLKVNEEFSSKADAEIAEQITLLPVEENT